MAFRKFIIKTGLMVGVAGFGTLQLVPKFYENKRLYDAMNRPKPSREELDMFSGTLPTRKDQLKSLQTEEFDVLVIGGGATGCGIALDSATRGLKTALVERYDFCSGTSGRSTKLIHGGVRYLEKAILNLDKEQYDMVKEALSERAHMIRAAPHIAHPLPILLPIYKWYLVPKVWIGIKFYDLLSGSQVLKSSFFVNKARALEYFPMLKKKQLAGGMVFFDGQQDDSRMCLSLALTAARFNATIANHTEVTQLVKYPAASCGRKVDNPNPGQIKGVVVVDRLTGKQITVHAKCVINATGPYTDTIRKMDDQSVEKICQPSVGVHITLPQYFTSEKIGMLDASTSDGRVIFFLPWLQSTIAGTTDSPCSLTNAPGPSEQDIDFIITESKKSLSSKVKLRRSHVQSAWAGLRPLVSDPGKPDTQSLARNHIIEVGPVSRLITIAGGKWTTYRSMAEETVDAACRVAGLEADRGCCTRGVTLEGGHLWSETLAVELVQKYDLHPEVASHLSSTYGDKSKEVASLADQDSAGVRLHPDYPYIEAEVKWACQREYACRAVDVLSQRTRLAHQNMAAAMKALPRVVELMGDQLGWSEDVRCRELKDATDFLLNETSTGSMPNDKTGKILSLELDSTCKIHNRSNSTEQSSD